jgi:hypothetical protein
LHTTARWAVEAEFYVTHQVHYQLLDHEFDAASDEILLWRACCAELGSWSNRLPAKPEPEPTMEVVPGDPFWRANSKDFVDEQGRITRRLQTFAMPTLESARILDAQRDNLIPPLDTAFCL